MVLGEALVGVLIDMTIMDARTHCTVRILDLMIVEVAFIQRANIGQNHSVLGTKLLTWLADAKVDVAHTLIITSISINQYLYFLLDT